MLISDVNMSNEQKQLQSDIQQTRAIIREKSRELVGELQETAKLAKVSVYEKVAETKQLFSISNYVNSDKHPWIILGGAILSGVILSQATFRKNRNGNLINNRQHLEPRENNSIFTELKKRATSELVKLGKTAVSTFTQRISDAANSAITNGFVSSVNKPQYTTNIESQESDIIKSWTNSLSSNHTL